MCAVMLLVTLTVASCYRVLPLELAASGSSRAHLPNPQASKAAVLEAAQHPDSAPPACFPPPAGTFCAAVCRLSSTRIRRAVRLHAAAAAGWRPRAALV